MASLEPEFYAEGFDPLNYIFSLAPETLDEAWLDTQIADKENVRSVVESALSDRVLKSYGAFGNPPVNFPFASLTRT